VTTLAIELNDAELRVARHEGVVAVEPGCALLDGSRLVTGTRAYRAARLQPTQTYDRFWAELGTEPLGQPHPQAHSFADLAFAQLSSLWSRFRSGVEEVVFVVPGSFRRDQLRLLLGIAEACGIPARGLVDTAVASSHRPYKGRHLAHLDVGLHGAVLTRLEQEGGVSRGEIETTGAIGLAALRECWLECIAAAFLTQARFDPLDDAAAEQALFDQLPACLERLGQRDTTRLKIEIRGKSHTAELKRSDLSSAAASLYGALVETLHRVFPRKPGDAETPVVLQVSHRLASLPGLLETLATLPSIEPVPLTAEASCMGALTRIDSIRGQTGRLVVARRLTWPSSIPMNDET
jgi:hypothetical protein